MQLEANDNRQMSVYEKGRLEDLRKWEYDFFRQNSMTYITWWNYMDKSKLREGTDLILQGREYSHGRFLFADQKGALYGMKMIQGKDTTDIITLRCVEVNPSKDKNYDYELKIIPKKTSTMIIPHYFNDYVKF